VAFSVDKETAYYTAKKERLEIDDPVFDFDRLEPEATNIERKLNIVLRAHIRKKIFSGQTIKIGDYSFLPEELYISSEYASRYPETYKSLVVAEGGGGDTLNLMLEKSDDHRLSSRLYLFLHESGEYQKFKAI
jgi:hypothetical protein